MKTIYLPIIAILFSSCGIFNKPVSHAPIMPNEPGFTGSLQYQANVALGFDHFEAQSALSVTKFLGFNAGMYSGIKGIRQIEYGATLFTPLNKDRNIFLSFGAGKGEGKFEGKYDVNWFYWQKRGVKTRYNSFYLQPALNGVYRLKGGDEMKLSVAVKYNEVFYDYFYFTKDKSEGDVFNPTNYTVTTKAQDPYTVIYTPFITLGYQMSSLPFFMQLQIGKNQVLRTFQANFVSGTGSYQGHEHELDNTAHPLFARGFLNISVGLRLDYFKLSGR